jgi:hypothetical protein
MRRGHNATIALPVRETRIFVSIIPQETIATAQQMQEFILPLKA